MVDKRHETSTLIRVLGIKKADLAGLADIQTTELSNYLRNRPLGEVKVARLEKTVKDIERVWVSLGIRTDLSDREGFARLLGYVNNSLLKEETAAHVAVVQSLLFSY